MKLIFFKIKTQIGILPIDILNLNLNFNTQIEIFIQIQLTLVPIAIVFSNLIFENKINV